MEYLLPSEVARLVYGYLELEKCFEAAGIFLKTSQHLQECYQISLQNRKFSTKVMGYTLQRCLDQFCAIHRLVQDRIAAMQVNNISSYELVDQVAYLLDVGCKGHSTVMFNITVPVQEDSGENRTINETSAVRRNTPSTPMNESSDSLSYSVSIEGSPSKPTLCVTNTTTPPRNQTTPVPSPHVLEEPLPVPETTSLASLPGTCKSQKKPKGKKKEPIPDPQVNKKAAEGDKPTRSNADWNSSVINIPEIRSNQGRFNRRKEKEDKEHSVGAEFESIIKTIVSQTQSDPTFENFLDEFFDGTTNADGGKSKSLEDESQVQKKGCVVDKVSDKSGTPRMKVKDSKGSTSETESNPTSVEACDIDNDENKKPSVTETENCRENTSNAASSSNAISLGPSSSKPKQPPQTAAKPSKAAKARTKNPFPMVPTNNETFTVKKNANPRIEERESLSSIVVLPSTPVIPLAPASVSISTGTVSLVQRVITLPNHPGTAMIQPGSVPTGGNKLTLPWNRKNDEFERVRIAEDSSKPPKHGIYTQDIKPTVVLASSQPDFVNIAPKGPLVEPIERKDPDLVPRKKEKKNLPPKTSSKGARKKPSPIDSSEGENCRATPGMQNYTVSDPIETQKANAGTTSLIFASGAPLAKTAMVNSYNMDGSQSDFSTESVEHHSESDSANNSTKPSNPSIITSIKTNDAHRSQTSFNVRSMDSLCQPTNASGGFSYESRQKSTQKDSHIFPVSDISQKVSRNPNFKEPADPTNPSLSITFYKADDTEAINVSVPDFVENSTLENVSKDPNCDPAVSPSASNYSISVISNQPSSAETQSRVLSDDNSRVERWKLLKVSPKSQSLPLYTSPRSENIDQTVKNSVQEASCLDTADFKIQSSEDSDASAERGTVTIETNDSCALTESHKENALMSDSNQISPCEPGETVKSTAHPYCTSTTSYSSPYNPSFTTEPGNRNDSFGSKPLPPHACKITEISLSDNKVSSEFKKLISPVSHNRTKKLSRSTPRNKKSHVRALDFNCTPPLRDGPRRTALTSPKQILTCDKISQEERFRNVCRSQLFESPSVKSIYLSRVTGVESYPKPPILEKDSTVPQACLESVAQVSERNLPPILEDQTDGSSSDEFDADSMAVVPATSETVVADNILPKFSNRWQERSEFIAHRKNHRNPRARLKKPGGIGQNQTTYSVRKSNYVKVVSKVTKKTVKSKKIDSICKVKSPVSRTKKALISSRKSRSTQAERRQKYIDGCARSKDLETSIVPTEVDSSVENEVELELEFKNGSTNYQTSSDQLAMTKPVTEMSVHSGPSSSMEKTASGLAINLSSPAEVICGVSKALSKPNCSYTSPNSSPTSSYIWKESERPDSRGAEKARSPLDHHLVGRESESNLMSTRMPLLEAALTIQKNSAGGLGSTDNGQRTDVNEISPLKNGIVSKLLEAKRVKYGQLSERLQKNEDSSLFYEHLKAQNRNRNDSSLNDERYLSSVGKDYDGNTTSGSCSGDNNLFIITSEEQEIITTANTSKIEKSSSDSAERSEPSRSRNTDSLVTEEIQSDLKIFPTDSKYSKQPAVQVPDSMTHKPLGTAGTGLNSTSSDAAVNDTLMSSTPNEAANSSGAANLSFFCVYHEETEKEQCKFDPAEFQRKDEFLQNFTYAIGFEEDSGVSVCKIAVSRQETLLSIPSLLEHLKPEVQSKIVKKKVYHHSKGKEPRNESWNAPRQTNISERMHSSDITENLPSSSYRSQDLPKEVRTVRNEEFSRGTGQNVAKDFRLSTISDRKLNPPSPKIGNASRQSTSLSQNANEKESSDSRKKLSIHPESVSPGKLKPRGITESQSPKSKAVSRKEEPRADRFVPTRHASPRSSRDSTSPPVAKKRKLSPNHRSYKQTYKREDKSPRREKSKTPNELSRRERDFRDYGPSHSGRGSTPKERYPEPRRQRRPFKYEDLDNPELSGETSRSRSENVAYESLVNRHALEKFYRMHGLSHSGHDPGSKK